MCKCSDKHIEQIQSDAEIIEDPYDKCDSEYRVRLVEKDKKSFPKARNCFSGCDIKPSFQETVGKFEKSISQSDKKADQDIKDKSIFVVNIKEIEMVYGSCIA